MCQAPVNNFRKSRWGRHGYLLCGVLCFTSSCSFVYCCSCWWSISCPLLIQIFGSSGQDQIPVITNPVALACLLSHLSPSFFPSILCQISVIYSFSCLVSTYSWLKKKLMAIVYFSHFWYYSDFYILVPLNHCKIFSCLIVVLRTAILKDPNMMMYLQTSVYLSRHKLQWNSRL